MAHSWTLLKEESRITRCRRSTSPRRAKLAISGKEKIEAYDQMENIADPAMPADQNRIVTLESARRKKS
jgi:hypothetical protein